MASGLEFTSYLLFLLCITSTSISLSLPPPEFTFSFFLFFSFLLSVLHFFFFFFVFLSFCFPFKMRVCGNPESIKALGAIFPTAWAHFASLCRMLVILAILQTSPFLGYLIWWSGVNDLGSTPKMHPNCLGEPPPERMAAFINQCASSDCSTHQPFWRLPLSSHLPVPWDTTVLKWGQRTALQVKGRLPGYSGLLVVWRNYSCLPDLHNHHPDESAPSSPEAGASASKKSTTCRMLQKKKKRHFSAANAF